MGFQLGIYSWLSRLNTARGSGTGLVTVGLAKVKACRSILLTEGIPVVKKVVFREIWLFPVLN